MSYIGSKRSSSLVSATEITLDGAKLKSSGDSITKSDGTTAVLRESGGVVTLGNATIDSSVTFPAMGQLAKWSGSTSTSASVPFALDGVSNYTFIGIGRYELDPYGPITLSLIIDSSNGTISSKTDNWGNSFNESFNNSTKVLTITTDNNHSILYCLIFKGAIPQ